MRKLAIAAATVGTLALAAAGTLLVSSGVASAEPVRLAQADVSVRIGDGHRDRMRPRHREIRPGWHARGCRTVTIRERHGNRVIIKKVRRC